MAGYLIERTDQGGGYVSTSHNPTGGSYTHNLKYAKVYPTREAAEKNRCVGNERVIPVNQVVGRG